MSVLIIHSIGFFPIIDCIGYKHYLRRHAFCNNFFNHLLFSLRLLLWNQVVTRKFQTKVKVVQCAQAQRNATQSAQPSWILHVWNRILLARSCESAICHVCVIDSKWHQIPKVGFFNINVTSIVIKRILIYGYLHEINIYIYIFFFLKLARTRQVWKKWSRL